MSPNVLRHVLQGFAYIRMRVHARTCGDWLDGRVQGVAVGGIGNGRKEGGRPFLSPARRKKRGDAPSFFRRDGKKRGDAPSFFLQEEGRLFLLPARRVSGLSLVG